MSDLAFPSFPPGSAGTSLRPHQGRNPAGQRGEQGGGARRRPARVGSLQVLAGAGLLAGLDTGIGRLAASGIAALRLSGRAEEAPVTAGPGDQTAAAWGSGLRASDAEREQVIGTLKAAFVQGRLTRNDLDVRAGQAFTARTWADLAALTADLPAGLTGTQPVRPLAARGRPKASKVGIREARGLVAPALFAASLAVAFGGLVNMALSLAVLGMVYFTAWLVPRARTPEWGSH
jgi:hypothetical protein